MKGQNLFNAAAVLVKAGEEIDAMLDKLSELLLKEMKTVEDLREVTFADEESDWSSPWVLKGYLQNYGLYRKRKGIRKPTAYLGIQIKLWDKAESEVVGPQALLYVMFSGDGGWSMDEFRLSTALSEKYELQDGWLWQWNEEGEDLKESPWGKKSYWAFVLPLVALNTPEDLKAMVVEPTKNIMNGSLDPKKLDKRILRFKVKDSQVSLA